MAPKIKQQQGYLLIVAIILTAIVGFSGAMLAYIYVGTTSANTNMLQSTKAFLAAVSGLEVAKREIISEGVRCENANYNNESIFSSGSTNGSYNVSCANTTFSAKLTTDITGTTTQIDVDNITGFAPRGEVLIESEIITYSDNTSSALLNIGRGAGGTTKADHTISDPILVNQNMCTLSSVGEVKTGSNIEAKRELDEKLIMGQGYLRAKSPIPGSLMPAIITADSVSFVTNNTTVITNDNIDGRGCAIAAVGTITGVGDYSCKTPDITENKTWAGNTDISTNSATFFNYFFDQDLAGLESSACVVTRSADIPTEIINAACDVVHYNPASGGNLDLIDIATNATQKVKTLIVKRDLNIKKSSSATVGSATQPLKIIVKGNITTDAGKTNTANIYGFLYALGTATMSAGTTLHGGLASMGNVTLGEDSGITVDFDSSVFNFLSTSSVKPIQSRREVFTDPTT